MKRFIQYIIATLIALTATGCQDDFMKQEIIGEGKAKVSATIDFKPMSAALTRTKAAGDVLKDINSLHVLLYNEESKLIKKWKIKGYTVTDENRDNSNAENGSSAETSTKRATFKLPEEIEFGTYYMYAVANIADTLIDKHYSEAIKTVEGLKNISLAWDPENVANNGQMIGFFTDSSTPTTPSASGESLTLNASNTKLHAWLRRAASKVTIAYDGTNLKDDVSIYIMAASIKDIPTSCPLGTENTPDHVDSLIHDGGMIQYFDENNRPGLDNFITDYKAVVSNQKPTYGSDHSETADALFFYENMQGKGKDKKQTAPGPGNGNGANNGIGFPDPDPDIEGSGWKDEKPYGTYIEVEAIYRSENPERPGVGIIKYRFMLGKDIATDYNAERNHHYKLTLKFNNFANDYDWHIEYKEQVLEVTDPKVMNYQGKVFVPDKSWPNLGHEFADGSTVTVTSYIEDAEKKMVNWKIEYDEEGNGNYKSDCSWLHYEIADGNLPYEKNVTFKVNEVKPDETIDINANLKGATPKGSKENPYNLADPNGTPDKIVCTANCYIVDAPGWYIFPLVYGNAIHNGADTKSSYQYTGGTSNNILSVFKNHLDKPITSPYIKENEGCNPQHAYLVWQDVNNLLRPSYTWETSPVDESPSFLPEAYNNKGGIRFYVAPGNIKQGNAMIAISDQSPTKVQYNNENGDLTWRVDYPDAIWSWHIWITRFDYQEPDKTIKVTAHDSNRKFEFMPVNLGWCSEDGEKIKYYHEHQCKIRFTAGEKSDEITIVKKSHIAFTRGNNPYYQWGRKDPFIAAIGNIDKNKSWWNYIGFLDGRNPPLLSDGWSTDGRITTREALHLLIRKPDTWHNPPRKLKPDMTTGDTNPWASDNLTYANLWEGRTGTDPNAAILKTVYDPCPVGYQVAHYNAFTGFTTTGENTNYPPEWYDVRVENIADYNKETGSCGIYSDNLLELYTNPEKYQSIIFPQSGYRDWDDWSNTYHFNVIGYVWAAGNVRNDDNNSYNFEFSRLDEQELSYLRPKNFFYPCDGMPIRPVRNGSHGVPSTP